MRCLNCHKEFIVKRNFRELFLRQNYKVCDDCLLNNKFNINYETIPLDNHVLKILTLYYERRINEPAFIDQLDGIYNGLTKNENTIYYKSSHFVLDNSVYEDLSMASLQFDKDIMIICLTSKIF